MMEHTNLMHERRMHPRQRIDLTGRIAVDEHRSLTCLIYDSSESGMRLTLPEAQEVPDTFLLSIDRTHETRVCKVMWRRDEEVGALFQR